MSCVEPLASLVGPAPREIRVGQEAWDWLICAYGKQAVSLHLQNTSVYVYRDRELIRHFKGFR